MKFVDDYNLKKSWEIIKKYKYTYNLKILEFVDNSDCFGIVECWREWGNINDIKVIALNFVALEVKIDGQNSNS